MQHHAKHHLLTREEIAKLAYEMYLIDGKPQGREVDHWLEAERVLLDRQLQQHGPNASGAAGTNNGKVVVKATRKKSTRRGGAVRKL